MEWINPEYHVRDKDKVVNDNGILTELTSVGKDSSLYSIELLPTVTRDELYVSTKDGKLYHGAVKCLATGRKDKVGSRNIVVNVCDDRFFQFMVLFADGTCADARGMYARTQLKIVSRRVR